MRLLVSNIRVEAPVGHLQHVLTEFEIGGDAPLTKTLYLIPDPTKRVDLDKYPRLKIISTPSTGTNHIDLKKAGGRGIKVLSLLDDREGLDTIRASSEFAFYMILNGLRLGGFRQWRHYERNDNFMLGNELFGKLVGIVGFGRIGQNVGKWINAFDARWLHYDKHLGIERLRQIFRDCDIILLSPALNEETEGMIDKTLLDNMKQGALLVNVSRAEVCNQKDLEEWCRRGGKYVTDVLYGEVDGRHFESPLLSMSNVIVSPHIAGHAFESTEKALRIALKLLKNQIEKDQ